MTTVTFQANSPVHLRIVAEALTKIADDVENNVSGVLTCDLSDLDNPPTTSDPVAPPPTPDLPTGQNNPSPPPPPPPPAEEDDEEGDFTELGKPDTLNMDVKNIPDINPRVRNAMQRNGIRTVQDLTEKSWAWVCALDGVGNVAQKHLQDFFAANGLSFGGENNEPLPGSKTPTLEQTREALIQVNNEVSTDEARRLLQQFNATSVSGVAERDRANFIVACDATLAKHKLTR